MVVFNVGNKESQYCKNQVGMIRIMIAFIHVQDRATLESDLNGR